MDQVERTARLIRSKGVGVYFVTQAPTDVPSSVLAQLGNRVQHALRAFTPDDADALRKTARTFPMTDFYDVEKTITSLGIGEALVTVLSPRGVPTPLAATRLLAARFADGADRRGPVPAGAWRRARSSRSTARRSTARAPTSGSPARLAARARGGRGGGRPASGVEPTTATGLNTMTPAQQQREIARQAREMAAAQRAAERERSGPGEGRARRRASAPADGRQRHPDRRQGRHLAARPGHHPRRLRDALRRRPGPLSRRASASIDEVRLAGRRAGG